MGLWPPAPGGQIAQTKTVFFHCRLVRFVAVGLHCERAVERVEPRRFRPAAGRWPAIHSALRHVEAAGLL